MKLNFDIEDVRLIKEQNDSQFSLLEMDVFASGQNRHNLYVPEEALRDAESSIIRKPVVWMMNKQGNDADTHSDFESACGFVPDDSKIKYRKLSDGRTMMSITSLIWRKYSGAVLDFFKRDGKTKPISVEIDVLSQNDAGNQILSFVYDAICILGSKITPAIPDAQATLLFSSSDVDEYKKIYSKEFGSKYGGLDFKIPQKIKDAVKMGLDKYEKFKTGGTSVALATARHLLNNEMASPEKVRAMFKHLKNKDTDNEDVDFNLWGGDSGLGWSKVLVEKMDQVDEESRNKTHFNEEEVNKENMEFDKDKLGQGDYSLTVDKSKDSLSDSSWGNVDKTTLRNKILGAKNYKSLVDDVYMQVLSGWEDAPSSNLKYPVMQLKGDTLVYNKGGLSSALGYAKANDESGVVSKINAIYKHLGLDDDKENPKEKEVNKMADEPDEKDKEETPEEEKKESPEKEKEEQKDDAQKTAEDKAKEDAKAKKKEAKAKAKEVKNSAKMARRMSAEKKFNMTSNEVRNALDVSLAGFKYGDDEMRKFWINDFDDMFVYVSDNESGKMFRMSYAFADGACSVMADKAEEVRDAGYALVSTQSYSLDQNLDMVALLAFLKAETEAYGEVADDADDDTKESYAMIKSCYDEASKPVEEMSMGALMAGMYSYCGKMSAKMTKMAKDQDVYMAENKELKAFKQSIEDQNKQMAVEAVLKEAFDAKMPNDRIDELRLEAGKFSMENLEAFKNQVKAEAFEFIKKNGKVDDKVFRRIGLPYTTSNGTAGLYDRK